MTGARLGNYTTVNAPSASLQVLAQNQNNLSSTVSQQTIGGIESNSLGQANAQANNLQTLAEIGNNANVTVAQFLLDAHDANLQANAMAKTEADAGSASDAAYSFADETSDAKAHVGSGAPSLRQRRSQSRPAPTTSRPIPIPRRPWLPRGGLRFRGGKHADGDDRSQPGPRIATHGRLHRHHGGPAGREPQRQRRQDQRLPEPGHQLHARTLGSETVTNTVNLNSNITLTGSMDHNLSIDPTGMVTAEDGLVVTDGTNPLGLGQTDSTGQIVVSATVPANTATLVLSAPGGTTAGASNVLFYSNGTVMIQNASPDALYLGTLNVVESGKAAHHRHRQPGQLDLQRHQHGRRRAGGRGQHQPRRRQHLPDRRDQQSIGIDADPKQRQRPGARGRRFNRYVRHRPLGRPRLIGHRRAAPAVATGRGRRRRQRHPRSQGAQGVYLTLRQPRPAPARSTCP